MSTQASVAAKPSLTLKRRLKASPAKVYSAWTEPQKLTQWWGPTGAETRSAEMDVRIGGRFYIVFTTPDGEEHGIGGVYRDVVPNEKLVFTWAWRTMPERESLVTITLKPDGNETILTLLHEQFFDEPARDRHETGWTGTLDKLEAYVAR
jgi:uncharacterized protein YndB with AHSA1/START domain